MIPKVDFLGVLFIVWGLLTTLVGVSTLALGVGAFALITSGGRGGASSQVAASLTAALFTTLAVVAIIWGAAHIVVGAPLRRHRAWARIMALVLASVDLLLLPCTARRSASTRCGCSSVSQARRSSRKARG